jgi:translation initiation factor 3 subunit F
MLPAEVEDADKAAALPNELAALEQSIEQLYECLERAGAHSRAVVAGKAPADAKLGREMADALASIPMIRAEQFDQLFSGGLQDLLMVSYLSGLTQAQLSMAEKLINT